MRQNFEQTWVKPRRMDGRIGSFEKGCYGALRRVRFERRVANNLEEVDEMGMTDAGLGQLDRTRTIRLKLA